MSALTEKEKFPNVHVIEREGWKMTIRCEGVYTEFIMLIAQAGDPKGSITLEGPGVKVSIGGETGRCPNCMSTVDQLHVNLAQGRARIRDLAHALVNVTNREPNYPFLHDLGREAFRPYDPHFV